MEMDNSDNNPTAQNNQAASGIQKKSIISLQDVKRTLLSGDYSPHPKVKPLAERLVTQKTPNLKEALKPMKQGVDYASELIHQLQGSHPSIPHEKVQHASRITDTIHLLEGLQKTIEKETRNLFIVHHQAKLGLEDETHEQKTLFQDSSILLSTLKSQIQTLEKMKTTSFE